LKAQKSETIRFSTVSRRRFLATGAKLVWALVLLNRHGLSCKRGKDIALPQGVGRQGLIATVSRKRRLFVVIWPQRVQCGD
jgi:hypothetical protein